MSVFLLRSVTRGEGGPKWWKIALRNIWTAPKEESRKYALREKENCTWSYSIFRQKCDELKTYYNKRKLNTKKFSRKGNISPTSFSVNNRIGGSQKRKSSWRKRKNRRLETSRKSTGSAERFSEYNGDYFNFKVV